MYASYKAINLDNMEAVTKNIRKCALSAADSKKYQSCAIHTYAYGSRFISEYKNKGCLFCLEDQEWERKRRKAEMKHKQKLQVLQEFKIPRKKPKLE